jgi:hypothetical protein
MEKVEDEKLHVGGLSRGRFAVPAPPVALWRALLRATLARESRKYPISNPKFLRVLGISAVNLSFSIPAYLSNRSVSLCLCGFSRILHSPFSLTLLSRSAGTS